jgi:hypothetical protein
MTNPSTLSSPGRRILKQGWARKEGSFIKSWKDRWFILENTILRYYTNENGSLRGEIDVKSADLVAPAPECRYQPALKIQIPGIRTYWIVCDTDSAIQEWITAINSARSPSTSISSSPRRVGISDFEILKVIGQGAYGKVQLVRHKADGHLYAMKYLSTQFLEESQQLEQAMAERDVLTKSVHPFLVGAHYAFQAEGKVFLILDYVPGGELFARLREEHRFDEARVRLYAAEILLGLGFLHAQGFVYRDLKPENILVDRDGHLRITDFGLVKGNMTTADATTSTFCGTPEYMPPEVLSGLPYTRAVDWWSLGVLIFEMLVGAPPFYNDNVNTVYRMVVNDPVPFPDSLSPTARDLIAKLLNKNGARRIGASERDVEEIKEHPFFARMNWEKLMRKQIEAPWKPVIKSDVDTRNFDPEFTTQQGGIEPAGIIGERPPQLQGFTFVEDNPVF